VCAVLPSGGKVMRLEELEASQLSPLDKSPLIPSGSSTPADSVMSSSARVKVSRDAGSTSADRRHHTSASASSHVRPAPALPAGAQVQTLEELEAGLRSMDVSSSPSSPATSSVTGAGDLTAFNKLLHFVNKSHPAADQACLLHIRSDQLKYLLKKQPSA